MSLGDFMEGGFLEPMRPIWTGSISFGLVNIPVRLYPASQERRLDFDYLRKQDLCPVGYVRVCRLDGREVPYEDIVRGYEYKEGDYVVLTDEDFKNADVKKTESIQIIDFVKEEEIDSQLFQKPYFIEPIKGASKVYALLREALKKSQKVGIARYVLRSSEHLGVVKVEDDILMLVQTRFASELRSPEELAIPKNNEVSQKELTMALSLIDQLTEPFKLGKYKDTYTDEVKEIIDKKIKGKKITKVREKKSEPANVENLIEKLKASLQRAKQVQHAQI